MPFSKLKARFQTVPLKPKQGKAAPPRLALLPPPNSLLKLKPLSRLLKLD